MQEKVVSPSCIGKSAGRIDGTAKAGKAVWHPACFLKVISHYGDEVLRVYEVPRQKS